MGTLKSTAEIAIIRASREREEAVEAQKWTAPIAEIKETILGILHDPNESCFTAHINMGPGREYRAWKVPVDGIFSFYHFKMALVRASDKWNDPQIAAILLPSIPNKEWNKLIIDYYRLGRGRNHGHRPDSNS